MGTNMILLGLLPIDKAAKYEHQYTQIWNKIHSVEGINAGDDAFIQIDEATRTRNAKLHSAGHLLDLAVQNLSSFCNYSEYQWEGAKGYHFEDGPYVEYKGKYGTSNKKKKAFIKGMEEIENDRWVEWPDSVRFTLNFNIVVGDLHSLHCWRITKTKIIKLHERLIIGGRKL